MGIYGWGLDSFELLSGVWDFASPSLDTGAERGAGVLDQLTGLLWWTKSVVQPAPLVLVVTGKPTGGSQSVFFFGGGTGVLNQNQPEVLHRQGVWFFSGCQLLLSFAMVPT